MGKLSKQEAEQEIKIFFENLKKKSPGEIKKIKRLAMNQNIKLGNLRKKFCKKCYSTKLRTIRIKDGIKTVECESCESVFRWKMK